MEAATVRTSTVLPRWCPSWLEEQPRPHLACSSFRQAPSEWSQADGLQTMTAAGAKGRLSAARAK